METLKHPPATRRIIHVIKHCLKNNGNVHVAVDLAWVQAEAGCEVIVASGGGDFVPMLEARGVRHVTLPQAQRKPLQMAASSWKLFKLCRTFQPDVLHAHMMGAALIGWIASKLSGVPLVTTVHNSFDKHSIIMRLGKRVIAVSHAEKQMLLQKGYRADQLDVVLNASVGSPREQAFKNLTEPTVLAPCVTTVCGLHRRKGVFDLIQGLRSHLARASRLAPLHRRRRPGSGGPGSSGPGNSNP